jgi:uncharacterized protein YcbX
MSDNIRIHSLHVYPIKSCQGIDLDQAQLTDTGIEFDRHWMLINQHGRFLSQREYPQMARIGCAFDGDQLRIQCDGQEDLTIPLRQQAETRVAVKIWKDECSAAVVSAEADQWFSGVLGIPCQLVFLPDSEQRKVDPEFAQQQEIVGFADGFPLLVVSLASVDLLNERLQQQVGIERFRPNVVLSGCEAHAEDSWHAIEANGVRITLAKPCSRCSIPSFDQRSGEQHPQLLQALGEYRRQKGKILFGQNGLHTHNGRLNTGDPVISIVD